MSNCFGNKLKIENPKALNRGDKIISINGKKIADNINTVEEAMDILHSHSKITLFVLRPKTNDEGLMWVNENT